MFSIQISVLNEILISEIRKIRKTKQPVEQLERERQRFNLLFRSHSQCKLYKSLLIHLRWEVRVWKPFANGNTLAVVDLTLWARIDFWRGSQFE